MMLQLLTIVMVKELGFGVLSCFSSSVHYFGYHSVASHAKTKNLFVRDVELLSQKGEFAVKSIPKYSAVFPL